jgi:hypothetical protein
MIKVLRKLGTEGVYLNIIKARYDKPIANFIPNGENLTFPLKSGMRQGCPLSPLLFNIVLEFLARAIRQEGEINGIKNSKETVKVSLFADAMILYSKTQNSLPRRHHKQYQQCGRIRNQLTKIISFLYTNNEQIEKNIGK